MEYQVLMTAIKHQKSYQNNKLFVFVKAQGFSLSNKCFKIKVLGTLLL